MFLDWYFINIVKFFTTFYPTPLISISEVMIPNHGNGPKSTHGAGPGSKKHKTICRGVARGKSMWKQRDKFWMDKRGATERSEPTSEGGSGGPPPEN